MQLLVVENIHVGRASRRVAIRVGNRIHVRKAWFPVDYFLLLNEVITKRFLDSPCRSTN